MTILADDVDIVIGIDPHKHTHTAAVIEAPTGKRLEVGVVDACPSGFAELLAMANTHRGSRCWVVEGCGSWGRGIMAWLQSQGEEVREIDSPQATKATHGQEGRCPRR